MDNFDDRNTAVLKKMLEEIAYLQDYTKGMTEETFLDAEDKKRVVSMTLINMGELVRHFTKDFRKTVKTIPLDDIIGLRDIAAHGYKSLKFTRIWNTIIKDIPMLEIEIKKLLQSLK